MRRDDLAWVGEGAGVATRAPEPNALSGTSGQLQVADDEQPQDHQGLHDVEQRETSLTKDAAFSGRRSGIPDERHSIDDLEMRWMTAVWP
jgi:hypothetical protein